MPSVIQLQKNDFSLPVIKVLHCDIARISDELKQYVPNNSDGFLSVPCVLSIEAESSDPTFLARLVETLRQLSFLPLGLKTEDESLFEQAHYAGLAIFNEKMNQTDLLELDSNKVIHTEKKQAISEPSAYTHHGNIAVGEQVYAEGRDLVVLGNVEFGGEAVADGNIYVSGNLNGKAYAGNSGYMNIDEITVRALVFEPELISIAGFYQLKMDVPKDYLGLSVTARFACQKFEYSIE